MLQECDTTHGALAQLGAHNTGSVGVRGSSPLCSTKKKAKSKFDLAFFNEIHPIGWVKSPFVAVKLSFGQ